MHKKKGGNRTKKKKPRWKTFLRSPSKKPDSGIRRPKRGECPTVFSKKKKRKPKSWEGRHFVPPMTKKKNQKARPHRRPTSGVNKATRANVKTHGNKKRKKRKLTGLKKEVFFGGDKKGRRRIKVEKEKRCLSRARKKKAPVTDTKKKEIKPQEFVRKEPFSKVLGGGAKDIVSKCSRQKGREKKEETKNPLLNGQKKDGQGIGGKPGKRKKQVGKMAVYFFEKN